MTAEQRAALGIELVTCPRCHGLADSYACRCCGGEREVEYRIGSDDGRRVVELARIGTHSPFARYLVPQ